MPSWKTLARNGVECALNFRKHLSIGLLTVARLGVFQAVRSPTQLALKLRANKWTRNRFWTDSVGAILAPTCVFASAAFLFAAATTVFTLSVTLSRI